MIRTNLHGHTYRCHHATGADEDYIRAALAAGFTEIGFSDHAPFMPFSGSRQSNYRVQVEDCPDYFASLHALREKYRDQITIHIGFEMEYYPDCFDSMVRFVKDAGAEYLVLGLHALGNELDGAPFSGFPTDDPKALDRYCSLLTEGLETGAFTYPAHPDLINFTGDPDVYKKTMRAMIRRVMALGYPLELNRLGLYEKRDYPRDAFWQIAGEEGARCVIGLDAHQPEVYTDTETVEKIMEYLARYGLTPEVPVMRPLNL